MSDSQFVFCSRSFQTSSSRLVRPRCWRSTTRERRCFARRALGLRSIGRFVTTVTCRSTYDNKLDSMVNAPAFKAIEGGRISKLANQIRKLGNRATHDKKQPPVPRRSRSFRSCSCSVEWFGHTYGRAAKPDLTVKFDPHLLPSNKAKAKSLKERQELEARLAEEQAEKERARCAGWRRSGTGRPSPASRRSESRSR